MDRKPPTGARPPAGASKGGTGVGVNPRTKQNIQLTHSAAPAAAAALPSVTSPQSTTILAPRLPPDPVPSNRGGRGGGAPVAGGGVAMTSTRSKAGITRAGANKSGIHSRSAAAAAQDEAIQRQRLQAQARFRLFMVIQCARFLVKLRHGLVVRRLRHHLAAVVYPKMAFRIQCLFRRRLSQKRQRQRQAASKILQFLRPRAARIVFQKYLAVTCVQRVARAYLHRCTLAAKRRRKQLDLVMRVVARPIRILIARKMVRQLASFREERSLFVSQVAIASHCIIREQRLAFSKIMTLKYDVVQHEKKELRQAIALAERDALNVGNEGAGVAAVLLVHLQQSLRVLTKMFAPCFAVDGTTSPTVVTSVLPAISTIAASSPSNSQVRDENDPLFLEIVKASPRPLRMTTTTNTAAHDSDASGSAPPTPDSQSARAARLTMNDFVVQGDGAELQGDEGHRFIDYIFNSLSPAQQELHVVGVPSVLAIAPVSLTPSESLQGDVSPSSKPVLQITTTNVPSLHNSRAGGPMGDSTTIAVDSFSPRRRTMAATTLLLPAVGEDQLGGSFNTGNTFSPSNGSVLMSSSVSFGASGGAAMPSSKKDASTTAPTSPATAVGGSLISSPTAVMTSPRTSLRYPNLPAATAAAAVQGALSSSAFGSSGDHPTNNNNPQPAEFATLLGGGEGPRTSFQLPDSTTVGSMVKGVNKSGSIFFAVSTSLRNSRRKSSRMLLPPDEVQLAFAALLERTESIERKAKQAEILASLAAMRSHVDWCTEVLRCRHQIPRIFASLLPRLSPSWVLRLAINLFEDETEGRNLISAEYDATPLMFLGRPIMGSNSERRRKRMKEILQQRAERLFEAFVKHAGASMATSGVFGPVGGTTSNSAGATNMRRSTMALAALRSNTITGPTLLEASARIGGGGGEGSFYFPPVATGSDAALRRTPGSVGQSMSTNGISGGVSRVGGGGVATSKASHHHLTVAVVPGITTSLEDTIEFDRSTSLMDVSGRPGTGGGAVHTHFINNRPIVPSTPVGGTSAGGGTIVGSRTSSMVQTPTGILTPTQPRPNSEGDAMSAGVIPPLSWRGNRATSPAVPAAPTPQRDAGGGMALLIPSIHEGFSSAALVVMPKSPDGGAESGTTVLSDSMTSSMKKGGKSPVSGGGSKRVKFSQVIQTPSGPMSDSSHSSTPKHRNNSGDGTPSSAIVRSKFSGADFQMVEGTRWD